MRRRFALRQETPDRWAVHDIFSDLAVSVGGTPMVGMALGEAEFVAGLLNLGDVVRRLQEELAEAQEVLSPLATD